MLAGLLMLAGADLSAQNLQKSQNRKAQLEKEIAQLDRQIKENASLSSNAMNELTLVRRRIDARKELIAESDREISGIDRYKGDPEEHRQPSGKARHNDLLL